MKAGGIPLFVFEIVSSSSAVSALFISDSAALGTESFSQHSPISFGGRVEGKGQLIEFLLSPY